MGSYISTYLYCLLVLNAIKESDNYTFIPSISILLAIFAAIVNIILLIIFIHQIAISIQADKVIADISDLLSKQVGELFPEEMGDETKEEKDWKEEATFSSYQKQIPLKSLRGGYLQYIDSETLMEIVTKNNSLLNLHHRPGNFLVKGGVIGIIYSNKNWEDESLEELLDQFVIGNTKTSQQDL